jgi:hypothetical protein
VGPLDNAWGEFVSAFEGGSNYWLGELEITREVKEGTEYTYGHQLPFLEGCALILHDTHGQYGWEKPFRLDLDAVERGIERAGKRTYHHCGQSVNLLSDCLIEQKDPDACTGDMFLQLCIFGEVIIS